MNLSDSLGASDPFVRQTQGPKWWQGRSAANPYTGRRSADGRWLGGLNLDLLEPALADWRDKSLVLHTDAPLVMGKGHEKGHTGMSLGDMFSALDIVNTGVWGQGVLGALGTANNLGLIGDDEPAGNWARVRVNPETGLYEHDDDNPARDVISAAGSFFDMISPRGSLLDTAARVMRALDGPPPPTMTDAQLADQEADIFLTQYFQDDRNGDGKFDESDIPARREFTPTAKQALGNNPIFSSDSLIGGFVRPMVRDLPAMLVPGNIWRRLLAGALWGATQKTPGPDTAATYYPVFTGSHSNNEEAARGREGASWQTGMENVPEWATRGINSLSGMLTTGPNLPWGLALGGAEMAALMKPTVNSIVNATTMSQNDYANFLADRVLRRYLAEGVVPHSRRERLSDVERQTPYSAAEYAGDLAKINAIAPGLLSFERRGILRDVHEMMGTRINIDRDVPDEPR